MAEIGYQANIASWATLTDEANEPNPDLAWPESINVYDRMRSEDSQVASVVRAVHLPILRSEWALDGSGCRDEVTERIANNLGLPIKGVPFVAPTRTRGRFSFIEHLRLALLADVFGHSYFEQVYDQSTGIALLAKLAFRPHRSIEEIEIERDGGLRGIRQDGVKQLIGVDRLVAYVNDREGANWLGRSILRAAYKNWLLKDRLLRIQAMTAERNGLGMPTYTGADYPDAASPEQIAAWRESELEAGLKIAKEARAGELAGVAIPHGGTFTFQGVNGRLPDTDAPIRYHDEQIARAVLAHFLNLGTETGSWALGSTFANFFTDSLNAVAQSFADTFNQHVIEDLVDLNFGPEEPAPRLVPAPIGAEHPATAEAIRILVECGAVTLDAALEAHVRALYGLPILEATDGTPSTEGGTDAATARAVAELLQKVYLAVPAVISRPEARTIARAAGADLDEADDDLDDTTEPPAEEAA